LIQRVAEEDLHETFELENDAEALRSSLSPGLVSLQLSPLMSYAQNLGQQPATGQAVQGQTAAQPEGTVLNLVNWVGNVIAPVGAALASSWP